MDDNDDDALRSMTISILATTAMKIFPADENAGIDDDPDVSEALENAKDDDGDRETN